MATNVTYNGVTYSVPQNGNSGWGTQLTAYLVALASGSLTKAGGVVTLTANLDLGANYGIKSIFFSDRGTAASAGIYRLSNNTAVSWRNAANDGNLDLTVNGSNVLTFNSLPVAALALGAANTVLKMNSGGTAFEYGTLVNANINASAAIAYSKLNLATSIVNADVSGSAAIAYSKLNLATSIVNADVSGSAAIAYSKLNLGTSIVNADVSGSAAIAYSKLNLATSIVNADISASAAIDGSKLVAASASVAGAMTTGTQTIAGAKTFTGNFYMGTNATALSGVTAMHTSTGSGAFQIAKVSDSSFAAIYLTRSRGSVGSETIVSNGDELGAVIFYGFGVSSLNAGAAIYAAVDGEPGTAGDLSDMPTALQFRTSSNGSATPATRMTLGSDGILVLHNGAKMDDDADQSALTYYRTANQSLNWQFNGTAPGVAVANSTRITRIGNIVHFHLGTARADTGTASTILSSEAWPTWAWPVRQTVIKGVHIRNNAASDATSIGVFQINSTDGIASIYRDLSLTAFTNSTNCGVNTSFSGCYAIE